MKQTWQHLEDCQKCSCNKNRKCDGYRVMVDKGYEFNPYKCEFMVGKRKKPRLLSFDECLEDI